MDVTGLTRQKVSISIHTLTAKDAHGKTRGLVRNVTRWDNTTYREQIVLLGMLKGKRNYFTRLDRKYLFFIKGKWYYLRDLRQKHYFDKVREPKKSSFVTEHNARQLELDYALMLLSDVITTIPCYMV